MRLRPRQPIIGATAEVCQGRRLPDVTPDFRERGDGERHRGRAAVRPPAAFGALGAAFAPDPCLARSCIRSSASWCDRQPSPRCWWGPQCRSRPSRPGASAEAARTTPITVSSAMGRGLTRRGARRARRDSAPGASPAAGPTGPRFPRRSSAGSGTSARPAEDATRTSARRASCPGHTGTGRSARRAIAPRSPTARAASVRATGRSLRRPPPRAWSSAASRGASAEARSSGPFLRTPRGTRERGPSARGSRTAPCQASPRRSRD